MSPDSYDGSYDFTNPQSFNRYSYASNDPANFIDPQGQLTDGLTDGSGSGGGCSVSCIVFTAGIAALVGGLEDLFSGGPSFHGTLHPRPAGGWDGNFGESLGIPTSIPKGNWGLGIALGLPSDACEFGACGGFGFQNTPVHGVWQYGHWCGAGGMGTPINQVDNFCMLHDLNLNKLKLDWTVFQSESNFSKLSPAQQRQIQEYDQELCDGEASVQIPWWNVSERTAASEIGAFFHSHVPKGARCH
jgi:hypothetical protein